MSRVRFSLALSLGVLESPTLASLYICPDLYLMARQITHLRLQS